MQTSLDHYQIKFKENQHLFFLLLKKNVTVSVHTHTHTHTHARARAEYRFFHTFHRNLPIIQESVLLQMLKLVGFKPKGEKSELEPVQDIQFLGVRLRLDQGRALLKDSKTVGSSTDHSPQFSAPPVHVWDSEAQSSDGGCSITNLAGVDVHVNFSAVSLAEQRLSKILSHSKQ